MYPYQPSSFYKRPRRRASYFLPFLSIIILGLIVVLVFQIADYFQQKRLQALENKAAVKIAAGRADMKVWGVDQWTPAVDSSILHEGDMIRTAPGSRIVLSLLNGSIVRLNSETEVELIGLKTKDGQDAAAFNLTKGQMWLKRSEKETVKADFTVVTSHLEINSLGTIFEVSNLTDEAVHVIAGRVQAAIKVEEPDSSKIRIAESVQVDFGQELRLGQSELLDLRNRRPVNVLVLLSDEFRESDWYKWNRNKDASGEPGVSVADAVARNQGTTSLPRSVEAPAPEPSPVEVTVIPAPVISAPLLNQRTIQFGSVTILGTASPKTDKIEVTTYIGGKPESYVLQRYRSGSQTWSYVVSQEYGNLAPGNNRYTITAVDKEGRRSDAAEIVIVYDRPKVEADLSAPRVTSFDGGAFETLQDAVTVEGSVGRGIFRVFVNNLPLTRYVPDSGKWVYYTRVSYGNLRDGVNNYEVYGVDADGRKTPVTRFTITKTLAESGGGTTTE